MFGGQYIKTQTGVITKGNSQKAAMLWLPPDRQQVIWDGPGGGQAISVGGVSQVSNIIQGYANGTNTWADYTNWSTSDSRIAWVNAAAGRQLTLGLDMVPTQIVGLQTPDDNGTSGFSTLTSGSAVISSTNPRWAYTNLVGAAISGPGIPADTTIVSIDSSGPPYTITMSNTATSDETDVDVYVGNAFYSPSPYTYVTPYMLEVTNGTYDTYYESVATFFANNAPNTIFRLAHEANNNTTASGFNSQWTSTQMSQWMAAWSYIAKKIKTTAAAANVDSNILFCMNPSAAYEPIDFASYIPNDGSVDILGMDIYDTFADSAPTGGWALPGTTLRFQQLAGVGSPSQSYSLSQLITLAESMGVPIAIPEWGLFQGPGPTQDPDSGEDDPEYVTGLAAMINACSTGWAWQAYWQDDNAYDNAWPLGGAAIPETTAAYVANFT